MRNRSRTRRAAQGAQFRPTQLPGCVLWLRADLGLTFGGMGTVTAAGTTPPTVTLSGVPNGPYSLRIETGAGALGAATFRGSLDGGATWPYTGTTGASVPLSSPIASGLTVAFGAGTYAADNVYTSASAVSQWSDQSGAGNHATQSTLANMPTWSPSSGGRAQLRFGGNPQYMATATGASNVAHTLFVAIRLLVLPSAYCGALAFGTVNGTGTCSVLGADATNKWWYGAAGQGYPSGTSAQTIANVVLAKTTAADGTMTGYLNGVNDGSYGNTLAISDTKIVLGQRDLANNGFMTCAIREAVVYTGVKTLGEIARVTAAMRYL